MKIGFLRDLEKIRHQIRHAPCLSKNKKNKACPFIELTLGVESPPVTRKKHKIIHRFISSVHRDRKWVSIFIILFAKVYALRLMAVIFGEEHRLLSQSNSATGCSGVMLRFLSVIRLGLISQCLAIMHLIMRCFQIKNVVSRRS